MSLTRTEAGRRGYTAGINTAHGQGYRAGLEGRPTSDCKYVRFEHKTVWKQGHAKGLKERQRLGTKP